MISESDADTADSEYSYEDNSEETKTKMTILIKVIKYI